MTRDHQKILTLARTFVSAFVLALALGTLASAFAEPAMNAMTLEAAKILRDYSMPSSAALERCVRNEKMKDCASLGDNLIASMQSAQLRLEDAAEEVAPEQYGNLYPLIIYYYQLGLELRLAREILKRKGADPGWRIEDLTLTFSTPKARALIEARTRDSLEAMTQLAYTAGVDDTDVPYFNMYPLTLKDLRNGYSRIEIPEDRLVALLPLAFAAMPSEILAKDSLRHYGLKMTLLEHANLEYYLHHSDRRDYQPPTKDPALQAVDREAEDLIAEKVFRSFFLLKTGPKLASCTGIAREPKYAEDAVLFLRGLATTYSKQSQLEKIEEEIEGGLRSVIDAVVTETKGDAGKQTLMIKLKASPIKLAGLGPEALAATLSATLADLDILWIDFLARLSFDYQAFSSDEFRTFYAKIEEFGKKFHRSGSPENRCVRKQIEADQPGFSSLTELTRSFERYNFAQYLIKGADWINHEIEKLSKLTPHGQVPISFFANEDINAGIVLFHAYKPMLEKKFPHAAQWIFEMIGRYAVRIQDAQDAKDINEREKIRDEFRVIPSVIEEQGKRLYDFVMHGHISAGQPPSASYTDRAWALLSPLWGEKKGPAPVQVGRNASVQQIYELNKEFSFNSASYRWASFNTRLTILSDRVTLPGSRYIIGSFMALYALSQHTGAPTLSGLLQSAFENMLMGDVSLVASLKDEIDWLVPFIMAERQMIENVFGDKAHKNARLRELLQDPEVYTIYRLTQIEHWQERLPALFTTIEFPRSVEAVIGSNSRIPLFQVIGAIKSQASVLHLDSGTIVPLLEDEFQDHQGRLSDPSRLDEVIYSVPLADLLRPALASQKALSEGLGEKMDRWLLDAKENETEDSWWNSPIRRADIIPALTTRATDPILVAALLRPYLLSQRVANEETTAALVDLSQDPTKALLKSSAHEALTKEFGPFIESGLGSIREEYYASDDRLERLSETYKDLRHDYQWPFIASMILPIPAAGQVALLGGFVGLTFADIGLTFALAANYARNYHTLAPYARTGMLGGGLVRQTELAQIETQFKNQMQIIRTQVPMDVIIQSIIIAQVAGALGQVGSTIFERWSNSWGMSSYFPTRAQLSAMERLGIKPSETYERAKRLAKEALRRAHPDSVASKNDPALTAAKNAEFPQVKRDWELVEPFFKASSRYTTMNKLLLWIFEMLSRRFSLKPGGAEAPPPDSDVVPPGRRIQKPPAGLLQVEG